MATCIEAVATAHGRRGPFSKGARKLADQAARACLARAGKDAKDIDLLINAGIYRDDNLAEPALASLIQEDIDANLGHPPRPGKHGTFSFDVVNGGVGVLTALELLDGFVRSGSIRTGMAVASDSNPGRAESFPFPAIGGALLVGPSGERDGFVDFAFESFDDRDGGLEASVAWNEHAQRWFSPHGANTLQITEHEGYRSRAVACATDAARRYLARREIEPRAIDLTILSQSPLGFAECLREQLGLDAGSIPRVPETMKNAHTAGVIAALEVASASGQFAAAKNVLFLAVGAGIVVGLALYRQ
jgi:3-oxoacyl-[acyl-carrier-protein] synthase-3